MPGLQEGRIGLPAHRFECTTGLRQGRGAQPAQDAGVDVPFPVCPADGHGIQPSATHPALRQSVRGRRTESELGGDLGGGERPVRSRPPQQELVDGIGDRLQRCPHSRGHRDTEPVAEQRGVLDDGPAQHATDLHPADPARDHRPNLVAHRVHPAGHRRIDPPGDLVDGQGPEGTQHVHDLLGRAGLPPGREPLQPRDNLGDHCLIKFQALATGTQDRGEQRRVD